MRYSAVIVGAGEGRRIGGRKLLLELGNKPLILWSLGTFLDVPDLDEIVVVVHHEDRARCEVLFSERGIEAQIVTGGRERQDSVYEGLKALRNPGDLVIVHDAARPFITLDMIHAVVGCAARDGAGAIVGLPVKETVKRVVNGKVVETLQRRLIWSVQTPQAFPTEMLMRSYEQAMKDGYYSTDDAALCERLGYPVEVLEGSPDNIKITTLDDLRQARLIMKVRGIRGEG